MAEVFLSKDKKKDDIFLFYIEVLNNLVIRVNRSNRSLIAIKKNLQ